MDIADKEQLFKNFPRLRNAKFRITSPHDSQYNCIAWAVGISNRWWWPSTNAFWPKRCPKKETISAFKETFASLRYKPCKNGRAEQGYEKIALFANDDNESTHAARQLKNGRWTSKLGQNVDIEHGIKDLEGPTYGKVVKYFRRSIANL